MTSKQPLPPTWTGGKPAAAALTPKRLAAAETARATLRVAGPDEGTALVLTDCVGRITRPHNLESLDAGLATATRAAKRQDTLPDLVARWAPLAVTPARVEGTPSDPPIYYPSPLPAPLPSLVKRVWSAMIRVTEVDVGRPALRAYHDALVLGVTPHWIVWSGGDLPRACDTPHGPLPDVHQTARHFFPAAARSFGVAELRLLCERVEVARKLGAAREDLGLPSPDCSPWEVVDLGLHREVGLGQQYLAAALAGLRPEDHVRIGVAKDSGGYALVRPDNVHVVIMGARLHKVAR